MAVMYDVLLGDIRMADNVSGRGGASATEIVSGGSVGRIPVLSGGVLYRFTDPLTALSIGAITSSVDESEILFTAGATVSPPTEIKLRYRTGENYDWIDDDEGGHDEVTPIFTDLSLTSSGAGYACTIGSRVWENFGAEDDNEYHSVLSGGSFTCASTGEKWVISAHGITQYTSDSVGEWQEGEYDPETGDPISDGDMVYHTEESSRIIDGWVASSTDLNTWTINRNVTIRCLFWSDWDCMTNGGDVSAEAVIASAIVTPCDLALPSGALLVNSDAIQVESGHRYEMNVRHGAIVTGDVVEAGE